MKCLPLFLPFFALFPGTLAANTAHDCFTAISLGLSFVTFGSRQKGNVTIKSNLCNNDFGVRSLWASAQTYCTAEDIKIYGKAYAVNCLKRQKANLTSYETIAPELTDSYMANLPQVSWDDVSYEIPTHKTWNSSVLLSQSLYNEAQHTVDAFAESYLTHTRYGWTVYAFWGAILAFGILYRLVSWILQRRTSKTSRDIEGSSALKKGLLLPASFQTRPTTTIWGFTVVPTSIEDFVILAYYALSIIICLVGYDIFNHNLYYTRDEQIWRYGADRTGILSYANLPVLWMFSGRNNVFLWATGWSFGTFSRFHRHLGIIATVQGIIHSILYTLIYVKYDIYFEAWKDEYWWTGGMATVTSSLILLFAFDFVRVKAYELFLLIHIGLSLITLVGLFYHTKIFNGTYDPYLWPLVAIWCFDRFARLVRQVYCNIHVKLSGEVSTTSSTVTYDKSTDTLRLEVIPGSSSLRPQPNQHYFLYQTLRWKGWENHPFTLASYSLIEEESATSVNNKAGRYKLVFYIRPFNGWTAKLRTACLAAAKSTITPRLLIEGPYGVRKPLHLYETVILVMGGTGISAATIHLQDHASRVLAGTTETMNTTLLWATKQAAMITDVKSKELKHMLGREDFNALYFATREGIEGQPITVDEKEEHALISDDGVEITYGRPDIKKVILKAIDTSKKAGIGGRVAVFVCGPQGMANDARSAVRMATKRGDKRVDLMGETFGW